MLWGIDVLGQLCCGVLHAVDNAYFAHRAITKGV
jgi:hypothetical protein